MVYLVFNKILFVLGPNSYNDNEQYIVAVCRIFFALTMLNKLKPIQVYYALQFHNT